MNKLLHLKDKSPDKTRKLNRRNVLWKICLALSLCLSAFTNIQAYPNASFTWNEDVIQIRFEYYPDNKYYWVGADDDKKDCGIFYAIDGGPWVKLLSFFSQGMVDKDPYGMRQLTHNNLCVFSHDDGGEWNRLNSSGIGDIDGGKSTVIYRHGPQPTAELIWVIPKEVKQAKKVTLYFKAHLKDNGIVTQTSVLKFDKTYEASISNEFANDKKLQFGYTTNIRTDGYTSLYKSFKVRHSIPQNECRLLDEQNNEISSSESGSKRVIDLATLPDYLDAHKQVKEEITYNTDVAVNGGGWQQIVNGYKITTPLITTSTFSQPKDLSTTYDHTNREITLKWKIADASAPCRTDRFVIERNDSVSGEIKTFYVNYKVGETNYSYTHPIGEDQYSEGGAFKYAYKVYREGPTGYGIGESVLRAKVIHYAPQSIRAENKGDKGDCILIKWKDDSLYPVWSAGTTCTLTRYNQTTGASININLTQAEYEAKEYIDKQVKTCNEYTYRIQVFPGNNKFPTQPYKETADAVTPYVPGHLASLTASKGYYNNRTELSWTSEYAFDNFIIERRPYNSSEEYKQIGSVEWKSSLKNYSYDDTKGGAGIIYSYRVYGVIKCGSEIKESTNKPASVGFRTPTGVISGRVTYESGQAVIGAEVFPKSNEEQTGKSLLLNGNGYAKTNTSIDLSDKAFTLQAWVAPNAENPTGQAVFSMNNDALYVGFDSNGKLVFTLGSYQSKTSYSRPENLAYTHITAAYTKDSLMLYVNGVLQDSIAAGTVELAAGNLLMGASSENTGYKNYFDGELDEVRAWNKALSREEVKRDYTRQLHGGESGLIIYYRFNEGVNGEIYDLSFSGNTYNENHGTLLNVTYSGEIPTTEQLTIKGITDNNGNYTINGVPYGVNGTDYRIIPRYGTHQFDPIERNINLSESSSNYTCDFTDKSAFDVSGYIFYKNSNIPVKDVSFNIDGLPASVKNKPVMSDGDGYFRISVPVGIHEVQAVKSDHTFESDGKLLDMEGNNRNYQAPISGLKLIDTTTARFIGRVAGGPVQESYQLGHSLSTNNLGDSIVITMELAGDRGFDLCSSETDSIGSYVHFKPSNKDDQYIPNKNYATFRKKNIEVYPSHATGEFAIDVIPENYKISTVRITGVAGTEGDVIEDPQLIDFSNSLTLQNSIYEYEDSVEIFKNGEKSKELVEFSDTVKYNLSQQFIKRVTPSISTTPLSSGGTFQQFIGDETYTINSLSGEQKEIRVYNTDTKKYLFDYPIMHTSGTYDFQIDVFESYQYHDENGMPVEGKKDKVPVTDGIININNDIKGSTEPDTLHINSKGYAIYSFECGKPNLSAQAGNLPTKKMTVSIKINNLTTESPDQIEAIILGGISTGNNFTTAGPDMITTVLRDPPGSLSSSFIESGTSAETTTTLKNGVSSEAEIGPTVKAGLHTTMVMGLGVATEIETDLSFENALTAINNITSENENSYTSKTEFTSRWETSSDPAYVGSEADVYIGKSTNIITGAQNTIDIIPSNEFIEGGDLNNKSFTEATAEEGSSYKLIQQEAIGVGIQFKTIFAYPQMHIENVIIPQLHQLIAQKLFLPDNLTPEQAQQKATNENTIIYRSTVNSDNETFATKGSYEIYYPQTEGFVNYQDTILTMIQSAERWEQAIADNEKAKIEAKNGDNYSFQGGSKVEKSMTLTSTTASTLHYEYVTGVHNVLTTNLLFNDNGLVMTVDVTSQTTVSHDSSSTTEDTKAFGFTLEEEGSDYISVDVKRVNNQDEYVFVTRGGATSCPYEGGYKSKYYRPGTVIDQPTAQVEVPVISVDKPVITNVPSTRKAVFKLNLSNESETNDDAYYDLNVIDATNPNGASFYIDGTALGNGRTFLVPAGGTLVKTLEVGKGTEMRYENLQLVLHSQCQYDPTGFQDAIADTVSITVEFVPSCSEVTVTKPSDKWTVNSESLKNGSFVLPIVLENFDVNYENFDHIEIQYKPSAASDDEWLPVAKFYKNNELMEADQSSAYDKAVIENATISYDFIMDNLNDQRYDICAVSVCAFGGNTKVETISNIASGIKDTYRPRLFGSPQPANGILGIEDEIQLNFNEEIAAGYIKADKIEARGVRNGAKSNNNTSISFDGQNSFLETELDKNFSDKSFTIEMNLRIDSYGQATLFSMGNTNEAFEIGFTADKYLQVKVGSQTIISDEPIDFKQGEWEHLAVIYTNGATPTVSAYYNYVEVLSGVSAQTYTGIGNYVVGRSITSNTDYFHGKVNELRIWNDALSFGLLNKNKGITLSGSELNLMSYYPMSAGKGSVVADEAGGNNMLMNAEWHVSNPGLSARFDGNSYLSVPTGTLSVSSDMDYTVEFWFKADASQQNAALVSNGKGTNEDYSGPQTTNGGSNRIYIGFENGKLITRNNNYSNALEEDFLDNKWHHYALSVSRYMSKASVYIDGELKTWFNSENLGGIAATDMYLGTCHWRKDDGVDGAGIEQYADYFTGSIDEFRLWNIYKNETLIDKENNVRLKGNETGLLIYCPFEKFVSNQGSTEMIKGWDNVADANEGNHPTVNSGVVESANVTSIKEVAEESPIDIDFVVNNDALIITPKSANAWNDYEQRIVTFKVKDIQDVNGNTIASPIIWTAFIDKNQIKWSDTTISKEGRVYNSIEFTTDIVNIGGSNQRFTIENAPSWLAVEPASGNIAPKSSQTVRFKVSEGLNIGSYDEILYLVNENNVSKALNLKIKVNGEKPDWNVNPKDFKYNMNVYGKMRIDNLFSTDAEDMLAAFSNGKCVGVANNQYLKINDMWYAFLTVYSNDKKANNLEFRMWDASTGKTYMAVASEAIDFESDAVRGSALNPIVFDGKELMIQNVQVGEGWNWVSFNVQSSALSNMQEVLKSNTWTNDDLVKDETNEVFASYLAKNNTWVGTMSETGFGNKYMYLVKSSATQTISVTGSPIKSKDDLTLNLKKGWNYISYLPTGNLNLKEALAGFEAAEGDIVKGQNAFAMYNGNLGWLGNLTYMEPGKGYMLQSSKAATLTYPVISRSIMRSKAVTRAGTDQSGYRDNRFASNMSVVATVKGNLSIENGDRILAYAGGELRGMAESIENPKNDSIVYFITIAGETKEPVSFALERNGKIIGQTGAEFDYNANGVKGNLNEPYALNFMKESEADVYPNPFVDELHVSMSVNPEATVVISLVDVSGRTVKELDVPQNGGYINVTMKHLGNLAGGIYMVNVKVDEVNHVYKVIKK